MQIKFRPGYAVKLCKTAIFLLIIMAAALLAGCGNTANTEPLYTNASTLAGTAREFEEPFGIAVKGEEIFVSDGGKNLIYRVLANGSVNVFATGFDTPSAIAFDNDGRR